MAHLDNLIESVKDPQLRAALRAEVDKVTKHRPLGLVFDRHLPESVTLPGFTIRPGEKVQVLADGSSDPTQLDGTGIWTLTRISDTGAEIIDGNETARYVPLDQLVATREFGDPIYPGLISTGTVIRGGGAEGDDGGKPFHTVINAENYHALEALLFAYEQQVDAIYIDPPYNTGARDWKYNNDYVDEADPYRHSKWLSFIERRLLLAKRLLNPAHSVLIVTIDEKEYLRLGLLLEQTFPSARVQMVSSVINPKGVVRGSEFARVNEYIFIVMVGDVRITPEYGEDTEQPVPLHWQPLRRSDIDSARHGKTPRLRQFYPIHINRATGVIEEIGTPLSLSADRTAVPRRPGCDAVFPVRPDGTEIVWGVSDDTLRSLHAKGFVTSGQRSGDKPQQWSVGYLTSGRVKDIAEGRARIIGRQGDGSVVAVYDSAASRGKMPETQWAKQSHNAQHYGTILLQNFLPDRRFPFPKSLYAVEDTLRLFVASKPDALVLDFFAGSGTTAHAVMRLNRQDGGHRRAVLVTNNEVSPQEATALRASGLRPGDPTWEAVGICEYITKPRIKAAITGQTPDGAMIKGEYKFVDGFPMSEGLAENVEFFDLTYEDPALVSLGRRFETIAPLLWLRAGATGPRITRVAEEGWSIPAGARYGILFNPSNWGAFIAAAAQHQTLTHAFIVTDSVAEYQQVTAQLDPTLKTTRLYADYLRNFEINTRR